MSWAQLMFGGAASAMALSSCANSQAAGSVADPVNPTQAELNAITDACDAPREWLVWEGSYVTFNPSSSNIDYDLAAIDYDLATCVLNGVRDSGISNFGFVGNERYQTPNEGQ